MKKKSRDKWPAIVNVKTSRCIANKLEYSLDLEKVLLEILVMGPDRCASCKSGEIMAGRN